jgi:hypothetical protein
MSVDCELARCAQRGNRVDSRMRVKTSVFSGDQHPAIKRIDLLGFDRQPPFAVRSQEPAQYGAVGGEHESRRRAAAVERRRRKHEISGRCGQKNGGARNYPDAG